MKRRRSLLAVQFTMPGVYPPLEHLAVFLASRGWKVELRGYSVRGAYPFEFIQNPHINVEQLPSSSPGLRLVGQYAQFVGWVTRESRLMRPDWIWASDSLGALPGLMASAAVARPLVYQEHDAPSLRAFGLLGAAALAFRRQAADRAAFCVVPGEGRKRLLADECPSASDIRVVWNCPRRDEVAPPRRQRALDEPLRVYYHGTLSPERLPVSLIQAVAAMRGRVRLVVRGYDTSGRGDDLRRITADVERSGAASWVELVPPAPRQKLWALVDSCHVGLALVPSSPGDPNLATMAGPSNKAFDYLARGLALVVAGRPEWQDLYVRQGYALDCTPEDTGSIVDALTWYVRNPEKCQEMGEAGRRRILEDWNYETVFSPVLARLLGS